MRRSSVFSLMSFDKLVTPESSLLPLFRRAPHPKLYLCRLVLPVLEPHKNGIKWCVSELRLVVRKLIPYKNASEKVHSPRMFLSLEASIAIPHPAPCHLWPEPQSLISLLALGEKLCSALPS